MSKFMLGKKAGMTQIFDDQGNVVPVTVVECGPVTVIQKKTDEVDGYKAIKVAFDPVKKRNKPDAGQYKKLDVPMHRYLREFTTDEEYELGQTISVADMFSAGDYVDVSGTSKGKGFAGGVKRHNFRRGPMAHGSKYHRAAGSLSSSATPARVKKGKKLPGQMGNERVTVQNLEVIKVDGERNILVIKGSVPGSRNNLLEIRDTVKFNK